MKKKAGIIGLFMSVLLLGACQKPNPDTTEKSTMQTSSVETSSSTTVNSTTSSLEKQSNEVQDSSVNEIDTISIAREQLIGKNFFLVPSLYDGIDANQAMEENIAPQSLIHDGSAGISFIDDSNVHIELAGTYRPDYDAPYTLTDNLLIIEHRNIPYSITDGVISFDSWTTDIEGHTITWSFGPYNESSASQGSATSNTTVDTKNLTSEQLKAWVSAVLDQQFRMGRSSFPYKLSVENRDGYTYVRVQHSELQVDTITMFRVNGAGQLEESDHSNGFPVTYKVMSSNFMDTSEVTVLY
ncbi:hypothetical protein [Enterococcus sp. AZ109]|uniref:hypothetical protein n=1 Tax=Enterococcus sp. AZ109 TaxID=2774634 RepID=UPI003F243C9E